MTDLFRRFAQKSASLVGSPWAFVTAVAIIIIWAATGPAFHFSDTWQLVINTGTTIITFLMVFLIQNTQNRDYVAIHLKLDELIRGTHGARNVMVDLEHSSEQELEKLQHDFSELHKHFAEHTQKVEEERNRRREAKKSKRSSKA